MSLWRKAQHSQIRVEDSQVEVSDCQESPVPVLLRYHTEKPAVMPLWLRRIVGLPIVLLLLFAIGKASILVMFDNPLVKESALPHPIPMPALPEVLVDLPAAATIRCENSFSSAIAVALAQESVDVWTYPATYPSRPDDSVYDWTPSGNKGPRQGRIPLCASVQVTDFSWSSIEGEFFVKVQVSSKPQLEQDGKVAPEDDPKRSAGWIPLRLIVFS